MSRVNIDHRHSYDKLPKDPRAGRKLGQGSFSRASEDKSDPHLIIKSHVTKHAFGGLSDMFDEYAQIVAKEQLWNMVHFPRVYAIKTYVDPTGATQSQWHMEKLIPMKDPSVNKRELRGLCERLFVPDIYAEIKESDFHISEISDQIDIVVTEEVWNSIKDSTFKKACMKLDEIYKKLQADDDRVKMDIHDENIMFRRTQYGLDVIFSDPFVRF
jgi:hypothetical protein